MTDATQVPCGIAIPQVFTDGATDMGLIEAYVRRAEEMGYHSLWVQEQILGSSPSLEPINLLCYVAAVTRTIRLGTAVIIVTTRNPVILAKELSTLDVLCDGRLIIGLALGGRPGHYPLLGAPTERRVRHFVESLEVMEALWQEPRASYEGHFWQLDGDTMEPKPVQQPHPPIWFDGRNPDSLRRAVQRGQGWMGAGSTTTEQFREHVGVLRESLDAVGRDPGSFAISKRIYIALDDDEDRAEERLRRWFAARYGNADLASRVSVWGSEARCIDGLRAIVDAGAEMLMLNPVFDHMEHLEALHERIVPQLRKP